MSACRRCGSTDPTVRNQVYEPGPPGRWEPCCCGWHNVTRVRDSTIGPRIVPTERLGPYDFRRDMTASRPNETPALADAHGEHPSFLPLAVLLFPAGAGHPRPPEAPPVPMASGGRVPTSPKERQVNRYGSK